MDDFFDEGNLICVFDGIRNDNKADSLFYLSNFMYNS